MPEKDQDLEFFKGPEMSEVSDVSDDSAVSILRGITGTRIASFVLFLALVCGKEADAFAQDRVDPSQGRQKVSSLQLVDLPQFSIDMSSSYRQGVEMIYNFLELTLQDADTVEQKIDVYKAALKKYSELEKKGGLKENQKSGIDRSKGLIGAKVEALSSLDGGKDSGSTWFDDSSDIDLLKFSEQFPELSLGIVGKIKALDSSSGLDKKLKFYDELIKQLQKRLFEDCAERERSFQFSLQFESDHSRRIELVKEYEDFQRYKEGLRHFLNRFGVYRDWMVTAQKAYERYADDKEKIESDIKSKIKRGELRIPKDAPYVIFVNRAGDEQYAVIYKYDDSQDKLILKTYNLVSTGSATRWLPDDNSDHSTPATVFHIGHVFNAKAVDGNSEPYGNSFGSHYVDQDQEPYKIFELVRGMYGKSPLKWSYFLHGTPEENLLGSPQSHGCIRVSRIFNLALTDVFRRYYYERYAKTRNPKDEKKIVNFESLNYVEQNENPLAIPVIVDDI